MEFKITRLTDQCFLISATAGTIPKASPSTIGAIVKQIKRDFQISPSAVRFFWPEENDADMIFAMAQPHRSN